MCVQHVGMVDPGVCLVVCVENIDMLFSVAGHGDVYATVCVVPFDGESDVSFTFPFMGCFVVFIDGGEEVFGMFLSNVFHSKIVDTESKADGAPVMFPETGVEFALSVSFGDEAFFKEFLCNDSCLWYTVHSLLDADIDKPVM